MTTQPSACERLAQSRERLRHAMVQGSARSDDPDKPGSDNLLNDIFDSLAKSPSGAGLVGDVLSAWWGKQPLRMDVNMAMEVTKLLVQPVARRHPYTLVLGAAAVGGLLVLVRPWRWISKPALVAGLLSRLGQNGAP